MADPELKIAADFQTGVLWLWVVKVSYRSFPPAYLLSSLSTPFFQQMVAGYLISYIPITAFTALLICTFIRYNWLNYLFYCFFNLDAKLKVRDPCLPFRVLFVSLFYFPAALLSQNACTQNYFFLILEAWWLTNQPSHLAFSASYWEVTSIQLKLLLSYWKRAT